MPMTGSVGQRISEFHHGRTYAKTKAKHGKAVANRQAIAAAMDSKRREGRTIGEIYRRSRKTK